MRPGKVTGRDNRDAGWQGSRALLCGGGRAGSIGFDAVGGQSLLVSADVNAVPPAGIEGLDLMANGVELAGGSLGSGRSRLAM